MEYSIVKLIYDFSVMFGVRFHVIYVVAILIHYNIVHSVYNLNVALKYSIDEFVKFILFNSHTIY